MKLIILLLSFSASAEVLSPEKGTYKCIKGSNPYICAEFMKPSFSNGVLVGLNIKYLGKCKVHGSVYYPCTDNECFDELTKFTIKDSTHYTWESLQFDLSCVLEKKR